MIKWISRRCSKRYLNFAYVGIARLRKGGETMSDFGKNNKTFESKLKKDDGKTFPMQILLAEDGSEHVQAAVKFLRDLPLANNTTVFVLAVVPVNNISIHSTLEKVVELTASELKKADVSVVTEVKGGVPAETINSYADDKLVDLIVVGAKGLRATLGILLGGTAQQVIEYAKQPVLVVRAPYEGLHQVLVVVDGSEYSQAALEYLGKMEGSAYSRLPLPKGTDVHIMHVLPPLITTESLAHSWAYGPDMIYPVPISEIDTDAIAKEEEKEGKKLLDYAVETLAAGGITAKPVLARGDAATEILNYIKNNDIDLVVSGSRGLSGVSSWLLGSVSRKLVHYANCSVLVIRKYEGV